MTFEEFFKKKKIDLFALQQSEPALFVEFKTHYEQMGEKSFDHTKKYWFNKLRRQFVPPVEIKTEKVKIENAIAEQTVTEALIDEGSVPVPQLGFKPKFRAAALPKAVVENKQDTAVPAEPPKLGFKPKFKAASMPKPSENSESSIVPEKEIEAAPIADNPPPKLGFKPKFKASVMPKPPGEENAGDVSRPDE